MHNACRGTEQSGSDSRRARRLLCEECNTRCCMVLVHASAVRGFRELALKITPSFERLQATLQQGMNRRAGRRILRDAKRLGDAITGRGERPK